MIQPDERGPEVGRALAGPKTVQKSPQGRQTFIEQRDRLKHTLGNLTLLAGSLNPSLSRSPWDVKKAELLRYSQPGLSRELHELEDWAEREILARGEVLAEVACGVWRYPVDKGGVV
ncbi:HNH endonuclease [Pseudomonas sp. A-1]|uniref:HNH endonuclease family protein n=1 Tax=Pseudomonas sp. A-1 TaxID=1821274 RepID=UPI0010A5F675|nr:HNH endonuclease family protein [Pseudomonas sp. A-1]THG81138.1 HNH endonuclease [Pseudomonas sp. A-1]